MDEKYALESRSEFHDKEIPHVDEHGFAQLAEEVHYGPAGARAFFSSPFVFLAALLASMGGFSYGYGTVRRHPWR